MTGFSDTYLGRLRNIVGDRLILMPGARIIIEDGDGRLLLQQRTDFGLWGLPGGNAEQGEDLSSIIVREVLEEVGIDILSPIPFGFASNPDFETIVFPNGHRCQYFVMMFFTNSYVGVPKVADDESSSIGWFRPTQLPKMLPNMRRSIEAYLRFKSYGEFQLI